MFDVLGFRCLWRFISPKACWCYSGENFMNICKRITLSCVHGSKAVHVSSKATAKFVDGMRHLVCVEDICVV